MFGLFNTHLDNPTIFFTIIVAVEMLVAVFTNIWASHRVWPRLRKTRRGVAAASILAFLGYMVLLFSGVDPGRWQLVLRGLAIWAVPVVYIWPAIMSARELRSFMQRLGLDPDRLDEMETLSGPDDES